MRVFIGYKYTNTGDKKELQLLLEKLGVTLKDLRHDTFILHRDYLGWKSAHKAKWKQGVQIVKNIWKSDVVLLVIPHSGKSFGLELENKIANFLGKKKILLAMAGADASMFRSKNNTYKEYKDEKDMLGLVKIIFG